MYYCREEMDKVFRANWMLQASIWKQHKSIKYDNSEIENLVFIIR